MLEKPKTQPSLVKKESYNLYSFIIEGEGEVQTKAFCDSYYKRNGQLIRQEGTACTRWSIGHGTISYRGEVITVAEADKRMKDYLVDKADKIPTCWKENQKIAILDYQYQFGTSSMRINIYANRCDYASVKQILYPYGKNYLGGVYTRRVRGYNYFNL